MAISRCATCWDLADCRNPTAVGYRASRAQMQASPPGPAPAVPAFAIQAQTATAFNPRGMAHDERPLTEVLRG